jgi:hypothetical protein
MAVIVSGLSIIYFYRYLNKSMNNYKIVFPGETIITKLSFWERRFYKKCLCNKDDYCIFVIC